MNVTVLLNLSETLRKHITCTQMAHMQHKFDRYLFWSIIWH